MIELHLHPHKGECLAGQYGSIQRRIESHFVTATDAVAFECTKKSVTKDIVLGTAIGFGKGRFEDIGDGMASYTCLFYEKFEFKDTIFQASYGIHA